MIFDVFIAFVKLGLPVTLLSWLVLRQLYDNGELDRRDDHKAVEKNLKEIRKARQKDKKRSTNLIHTKWMQFGGGFYGAAGLWTFVVIEIIDIINVLSDLPGFIERFNHGLVNLLVDFVTNQIMNFVAAIIWFRYWAESGQSIGIWFLVAYVGYLLGMKGARDWHQLRW